MREDRGIVKFSRVVNNRWNRKHGYWSRFNKPLNILRDESLKYSLLSNLQIY